MTATIKNPHVKMLCDLAHDDESVLQFPLPDSIYGFHAQQSCEKLLKALIAANGQAYDFTHNLEKLLDVVADCGETLPTLPYDVLELQPYAVAFRYDVGDPLPDVDKASILESVGILRQYVIARVLAIESAP